jgi:hypothetical protein
MRELLKLALACGIVAAPSCTAFAQSARIDYKKPETWLCRPDNTAFCAIDLTATSVDADGTLTREPFVPASQPAIDCFYVYPTVSRDPAANSDMQPNDEERNVAASQLARFGSQCRIFAPLYRQATLAGVRAAMSSGESRTAALDFAYRDVVDAWNHYLARDNGGRGVVLYGHSQGSRMLMRLIAEQIEGKPVQKRVVSALLTGINILVPKGGVVGGDLKSTPLCKSPAQTGCLVAFTSFRATHPPQANSYFGRSNVTGMQVACTNPAALGGGRATIAGVARASSLPLTGLASGTIETPYVRVPGAMSAECVERDGASYLAISTSANDPRGARAAEYLARVEPAPPWGLHLVDVHLTIDSLVQLIGEQAKAYAKATAP